MHSFQISRVVCVIAILIGLIYAIFTKTDVGTLCALIVIMLGWITRLLGQLVDQGLRRQ